MPLTVLALIPRFVTHRAVARAGIVATACTLILLIAAPIYPWVNYRLRPMGGSHAPYHEIAEELTKVWRARFNTPLPIVVGGYEMAAYVVSTAWTIRKCTRTSIQRSRPGSTIRTS